ncbi:MAG: DUF2490 domain-containing protein [Chitinophagaceae bacterium]
MKRTLTLTLLVITLSCNQTFSQTQFMGWLASFQSTKTGKHTSILSDVQLRSSDGIEHVQTLLLRAGFTYHAGRKFLLTTGYAFVDNRRTLGGISGYIPEHRIWEQVIFNHKQGRLNISHRLRLEQRFIGTAVTENDDLRQSGHVYANRFRYFIRNILPFRKQETFKKGLFAALQDEVFLNIGNKANVNGKGFDQNRLYLALGYRLKTSIDLEAGYLNQYISGVTGRTNNHVAQLVVYLRL